MIGKKNQKKGKNKQRKKTKVNKRKIATRK